MTDNAQQRLLSTHGKGHLSDSPHKNSKMKSKSFLRKSLYLLYISFTNFANVLDLGIAKVCSIGPPTPELVGADGINLGIKLQIHNKFSLELSYKIYMQEPSKFKNSFIFKKLTRLGFLPFTIFGVGLYITL